MPKYIDLSQFLPDFVGNVLEYSKCEEKDVCQYTCDLFKGIIHPSTIRRHLPDKYKSSPSSQRREKGRFS